MSESINNCKRAGIGCYLLSISLFAGASAYAQPELTALFNQANQQYQSGAYEQAIELYERIVEQRRENWQVYYNLGNAYYKTNRIGKAILNYERALRLDNSNEDIRFNLQLANLTVKDRIVEPPRPVYLIWYDRLLHMLSIDLAAILGVIAWAVIFAGLILTVAGSRVSQRRWGRRLAWIAASGFLIFATLFALQYYHQSTTQEGVVMSPRLAVRSSPADDATEVFYLHEGAKVGLQDRSGEWTRIRLKDGKVGWLKSEAVEQI